MWTVGKRTLQSCSAPNICCWLLGITRDAGTAVGQGTMQTYKIKKKKRYQLCLFLFNNNVGLKNNKRNYRKSFLISAINLFQVDRDKPWNYLWYCYEKAPTPPLPSFSKAGRQCPHSPTSLYHTNFIWATIARACVFLVLDGPVYDASPGSKMCRRFLKKSRASVRWDSGS